MIRHNSRRAAGKRLLWPDEHPKNADCSSAFAAHISALTMTRTKDDLKKASEHLHYEWDMLNYVAQAMVMNFAGSGVLNNAMLESFAVHVRGLIFFLFPEKAKRDDVLATHFVSDAAAFETARGVKSEILKKAQSRAGKEVAHLTYERLNVTAEAKPWPFGEIATEVNRVMKIFLQHADQSKLSEMWTAE
jgi:hypothetical protein